MAGFFLRHKLNRIAAAGLAAALALSSSINASAAAASANHKPAAQMQLKLNKFQKIKKLSDASSETITYLRKNGGAVAIAIGELGVLSMEMLPGGTKKQERILYDYIEAIESLSKIIDELERLGIVENKIVILHNVVVEHAQFIDQELFNTAVMRWPKIKVRAIGLPTIAQKRSLLEKNLAFFQRLYRRVLESNISFPRSTEYLQEIMERIEVMLKKF